MFFIFITLGRREQVEIFEAGRADLLLAGSLPGWEGFYSVGFLFFGAGLASFGLTLLRTQLTRHSVSLVGVLLGVPLAVTGYARLVLGSEFVPDMYLLPFLFLMIWLFVLGIIIVRHTPQAEPITDQSLDEQSELSG